jgi:ligand-binding sensor domain-containing protein
VAGAFTGLQRLETQSGQFVEVLRTDARWPVSYQVWTILAEGEDRLWFGTGQGLHRLEKGQLQTFTTQHGLAGNAVSSILKDSQGSLWVIAGNRLHRFQDGTFVQVTSRDGLSDDYDTCSALAKTAKARSGWARWRVA